MVENRAPTRPALGLHQCFHLRVVNPPDLVLVEEIDDLGVVPDKAEPIALESETVNLEPPVTQDYTMLFRHAAAHPPVAAARLADQGDRHLLGIDKIAERRLDRFRGGVQFGQLNHEAPPHVSGDDMGPLRPIQWQSAQATDGGMAAGASVSGRSTSS